MNKDFIVSVNTNPFPFPHYDNSNFAVYASGKQIPSGGMLLNPGHEKATDMEYGSLFEASVIRHSNTGRQITHDIYIAGYFMLFDVTPDHGAAEGHTSHPDSGDIRIELKFKKALRDALTCRTWNTTIAFA
jgi:hypothetical protein